jgi:tetratricopeptide (TPR) repeat protein
MAMWSFLTSSTVGAALDWLRAVRDDPNPLVRPAAAIAAAWSRLAIEARPAATEVERVAAMVSDGTMFSQRSAGLAQGSIWVMVIGGRLNLARDVGEAVVEMGEHQGSLLLTRVGRFWRAVAEHDLGLVADAVADCAVAFEQAVEGAGDEEGLSYNLSSLIDSHVEAGEPERAEAALSRASLSATLPPRAGFALLIESRGRLRRAQGRPIDALEDLLDAGRRWQELRVRSPVATSWRGDAALVLCQLGRFDEADRLASEQLALARQAEETRALGASLRVLGEVRGGAGGRALLEEAVTALEGSAARLELAKALLSLGRHRRPGRCRVDRAGRP